MDAYLREKSRIFGFLKPGGAGVINADDPMLVGLAGTLDVPRLVTFGIKHEADVRAENIRLLPESTDFDVNAGDHGRFHVRARLPGLHNVYNMTAAAACLICGGIAVPDIKKGLENASSVPGRLEKIESRAPFKVFVDYAHTPDALENVLKCLRGFTKNRLICVFGCGGDRDKAKRPLMGRIAAGISDHVILTSDNPRQEDPEEILRQIEKGMPGGTDYSIIILREQAILKSLELAGEGDVVVIAGKGHEDRQILGGKVIPFDDREVAARILDKMGYGDADDPRDRER
ncbi:MAG: UDP-N-acetylmuramyl-tripeptide synthetase, partial [Candidatus Omnitrophica bacterium]|nr:UDP-N-acetylmuramyl-tripeptide synthetase [Candidatus Omnitrophota bacterium]